LGGGADGGDDVIRALIFVAPVAVLMLGWALQQGWGSTRDILRHSRSAALKELLRKED
jgi:hypothetical protein